jgi:hypothetical protein
MGNFAKILARNPQWTIRHRISERKLKNNILTELGAMILEGGE